MELRTSSYEFEGTDYTGYFAEPASSGPVPGILVIHEGAGLGEHTKTTARRLAEMGYVAYAMDLFGETDLTLERAMEHGKLLRGDRALMRRRTQFALDHLRAHERVDPSQCGGVGYCFGGMALLELVRHGTDLACVIGFHAGLDHETPAAQGAYSGRVLVCQGALDPIITEEKRAEFVAEMSAAGIDWQMNVYGRAAHSFTNPDIASWNIPGFAHEAESDARSWRAMVELLNDALPVESSG